MTSAAFQAAAFALAEQFGPDSLHRLAAEIERDAPLPLGLAGVDARPGLLEKVRDVVEAQRQAGLDPGAAVAYLRGVADGYRHRGAEVEVSSVWNGPSSHAVPVRSGAQVLVEVVEQARKDLLLMTYSARPYPPLTEALLAARSRGVTIDVVVETLAGAGSALSGSEPAAAFAHVPGIRLWHWPVGERTETGAKMHAKVAVADSRLLLVTSANLTQSGVGANLEAGLLVRGGSVPQRVVEHVTALRASGTLARLMLSGVSS